MYSSPLLETFLQLQHRKFSLGIAEYLAALNALAMGFGTGSREELISACQVLWAKTQEQQRQIREVLELTLPPKLTASELQSVITDLEITELGDSSSVPTPKRESALSPKLPNASELEDKSSSNEGVDFEWRRGMSERSIAEPSAISLPYNPNLDFTMHLPVTHRQIFQIWRYYRRLQTVGQPVELDVDATVKGICTKGVFLESVFVPRRANQARLTMLIDCGGSMLPFAPLADALIDSAYRSGLQNFDVYYFHDAPDEHLFTDSLLNDEVALDAVIPSLSRVGVLIFSDGGAARGRTDMVRVGQMQRLIQTIRAYTPNVAWLNPMPPSRWSGTTVEHVQQRCNIPMFPFDRNGIEKTINTLRGIA